MPTLRTLLVPLSGEVESAKEAIAASTKSRDVEVLTLAQLFRGGTQALRRRYFQIAIAGSPPGEEIGSGMIPFIALASRSANVLIIDLRSGEVRRETTARYIAKELPHASMQLLMSAAAVGGQRALTHFVRNSRADRRQMPDLRDVLYIRPSVGASAAVGGSATHAHEVIRALIQNGIRVDPVTTDASIATLAKHDLDSPCQWRFVPVSRVFKGLPASAGFGSDVALLRSAMASPQPRDIIYQRHARFSLVGALLARRTGTPLFLEYNSSEEFVGRYWNPTPLKGQLAACERAVLTAATRIFVVSDVSRQALVDRGIDPSRIVVNPNGVAVERFHRGGGSEVRARLGLAAAEFVVGFVGTFGPWHGAPVLARAFASLAEDLPEIRLILVGDGPELGATRQLLAGRGLAARAIFVGKVLPREVPGYLDACDVLVSPHVPLPNGVEFFGSPTKLFEYMASGKAIVASELGQIGDVLEHKRTAWLVPPGDEEALASALRKLARSPSVRTELGARARDQASAHTWRKNAQRIIDAYRSLPPRSR
jgi:glycosyltransferase involved in cell wall biosynthesis